MVERSSACERLRGTEVLNELDADPLFASNWLNWDNRFARIFRRLHAGHQLRPHTQVHMPNSNPRTTCVRQFLNRSLSDSSVSIALNH
jgi:hypothetical protein